MPAGGLPTSHRADGKPTRGPQAYHDASKRDQTYL